MSVYYSVGLAVGIVAAALLFLVIGYVVKKKCPDRGETKYDERQEAARGRVFRQAYFTLLIYLLAYGLFDVLTGIVWCERFVGVFIGALLSVTVFAVGSVMNDAYFRVNENPRFWVILFIAMAVLNLGLGIWHMVDGDFVEDGMLSYNSMNFLVGLMCAALPCAVLVKGRRDRDEE